MDNDIKAWLYDILNAMLEIESFFDDHLKEFAAYRNDLKTKRAVERNLEIIGEALGRILKRDFVPAGFSQQNVSIKTTPSAKPRCTKGI